MKTRQTQRGKGLYKWALEGVEDGRSSYVRCQYKHENYEMMMPSTMPRHGFDKMRSQFTNRRVGNTYRTVVGLRERLEVRTSEPVKAVTIKCKSLEGRGRRR